MASDVTATSQLTILLYHAVVRTPLAVPHPCFLDERSFRSQMAYVKKHYEVLPLAEALERLASGTLERPAVAVTFDDGFENNFTNAYPVLKALAVPASIFLISGYTGTAATPWFCHLHQALTSTSRSRLDWHGRRYDLEGWQARERAAIGLRVALKQLPQPELHRELETIVSALGDAGPLEAGSPFRMLSRDAIRMMAASGLVEFGAHTHTHAILTRLAPQEARAEIEQSITAVETLTGRPCRLFAYPNGTAADYDESVMATLRRLGIRVALTAMDGANDRRTPLLELRRRGVAPRRTTGWAP